MTTIIYSCLAAFLYVISSIDTIEPVASNYSKDINMGSDMVQQVKREIQKPLIVKEVEVENYSNSKRNYSQDDEEFSLPPLPEASNNIESSILKEEVVEAAPSKKSFKELLAEQDAKFYAKMRKNQVDTSINIKRNKEVVIRESDDYLPSKPSVNESLDNQVIDDNQTYMITVNGEVKLMNGIEYRKYLNKDSISNDSKEKYYEGKSESIESATDSFLNSIKPEPLKKITAKKANDDIPDLGALID